MAVDDLPFELPKTASERFGDTYLEYLLSAFFDNDERGISKCARITIKEGTLTERFSYLKDYISSYT